MGFRVYRLGFIIMDLGLGLRFRVEGSGCRIWGLGFNAFDLGLRVQGIGFKL